MSETGAVKFSYEHVAAAPADFAGFAELRECRRKLRALGLIGVGADGIGFGNVSVRDGNTQAFHVTGSGTGGKADLSPGDCAKVTGYDFERNWLRCEGENVASSESLTHAAVYEAAPETGAVIHCHALELWNALLGRAPTTRPTVDYGTPAMAREVQRLFATTDVRETKLFVMAGHREGLVSFGRTIDDAFAVLNEATRSHGRIGRKRVS